MARMAEPHRILIIRPSALGDVCRSVPVLTTLRRAFPEATIDWLVQDSFAPAIATHRDLDGVIPFPRRHFAAWWRRPSIALELLTWLRDLRARRYDLVIDAQGLGRSGVFAYLSGAPRRIGHAHAREGAWLAYTDRVAGRQHPHTVDEMMTLLEPLDITPMLDLRLDLDPDAEAWWDAERRSTGYADRPYTVFAPTARWASKRWPIDRWVKLRDRLHDERDELVVIIGAPGEEDQVAPLRADIRPGRSIIDLVGHTSIPQTMAVIGQARAVVANDSAPLHMAVGFERPCIGLFGPTDERRVGPYGRIDSVVRAVPLRDGRAVNFKSAEPGVSMMSAITVEQVAGALRRECARAEGGALNESADSRPELDAPCPPNRSGSPAHPRVVAFCWRKRGSVSR
ncbi:MAG: glycosyltransferase family 9 protein [Phycisphaerales bacterium]|nr:glycosyltransferase family 9 protein [Phycisphaerales bacterium]